MAEGKPGLGSKVSGGTPNNPASLVGRKISLNLKSCKWFMTPNQDPRLYLNPHRPTAEIPVDLSADDLKSIMLKIKIGHLVLADKPVPEHTKISDVIQRHTKVITENFDFEYTSRYVNRIFNGPSIDGGYSKIEILESMLQAENAKGGAKRKQFVEYLSKAIEVIARAQGGHGKVTREEVSADESTSGNARHPVDPAKIEDLLSS